MARNYFRGDIVRAVAVALVAWGSSRLLADPPAAQVSAYAPAADLTAQVEYYRGRLTESLANAADYDEAKQSRVHKDGSTLAVLALVLGNHDEANNLQGCAAGAVKAAETLADSAGDYTKARQAFDDFSGAVGSDKGQHAAWGQVAEMAPLMKQVPVVNNALRRSLEPARFKKQGAQVAQQAATLAAIAQAAQFDTSAVGDAADADKWRAFCIEMRDAAGALNQAAHAGDQPAASAAAKHLAQSCDKCHAKFRQ